MANPPVLSRCRSQFVNSARIARCLLCAGFCLQWASGVSLADAGDWQAGFGKQEITPTVPVRLSGYGNRTKVYEGIDLPIFVRAVAIQYRDTPALLMLSIETTGLAADFTKDVCQQIEKQHGLPRERIVLSVTHTHTTPHLGDTLDNIYGLPLTEQELQTLAEYTATVRERSLAAAKQALTSLAPARLFWATGEVLFAQNRRVLKEGKWTGFGVQAGGIVDHSLPVLRITDDAGTTLRGVVTNYACHCTTYGGDYNRVNSDWAGYAAQNLEQQHSGIVALSLIGCGADMNPHRDAARARELGPAQGKMLSDEVERLLGGPWTELSAAPRAVYGYAGLPIDRPTPAQLQTQLKDARTQWRQNAEHLLSVQARMGRLPETYPMPIQVWRFGNELAMVFLGGEVVVDYAYRIRKELGSVPAWVTAYSNDVFGYVASERMREEGGYEYRDSMVYYNQTGPWSQGTEDVVLKRVVELFEGRNLDRALSVAEALRTFTLPAGFGIEVVAAEPLIRDPVYFTIDARGRLWVVEMHDYPQGADGDGAPGGRIRILTDTDADGRYDQGTTFLDKLTYPTGVLPWRDGAFVSCSPEVFFAGDENNDGVADSREVWISGFKDANPQHRVNGFAWGLDNWIYLAMGDPSTRLTSHKTNPPREVDVSRRDCRFHPLTGEVEAISGLTQYGRVRDDWGDWFGNTNSEPLMQFVLTEHDLKRNPFVAAPSPRVYLTVPAVAPPVYPTSRTLDRFNDLFALNRFTSACSPCLYRDDVFGPEFRQSAFICEPVHNLVSRVVLTENGVTYTGARHASEQQVEFLSSTDNWFRPNHMLAAPDGTLWVSDMYRHVIEHPQWIPLAWQKQLDVRAGSDRGRIYRIFKQDVPRRPVANLAELTTPQLVDQLADPNGLVRDNAHMLLLTRNESAQAVQMQTLVGLQRNPSEVAIVHGLAVIAGRGPTLGELGMQWDNLTQLGPHVAVQVMRLVPELLRLQPPLEKQQLAILTRAILRTGRSDQLRLQVAAALAAGELPDDVELTRLLGALSQRSPADQWLRASILSSAPGRADRLLVDVLRTQSSPGERDVLVNGLISTALGANPTDGAARILTMIGTSPAPTDAEQLATGDWRLAALATCLDSLARHQLTLSDSGKPQDTSQAADWQSTVEQVQPLFERARTLAPDTAAPLNLRTQAVALLGRSRTGLAGDREILVELLGPQSPIELQAGAVHTLVSAGELAPLFERWKSFGPRVRAQVLAGALTREASTRLLVDQLQQGGIAPGDLDAATRTALTGHKNADIASHAAATLGPVASRQEVLTRFATAASQAGDATRGRPLFEKHCAACHKHGDVGTELGPKLSALTNKSGDYLLTAILDPNRAVEGRYTSYSIRLQDGRTVSGMITEEAATSLTLARTDGKLETLLRVDVDELSGTGKSFMPEGLEQQLTVQDLSDLMEFVRSP